MTFRCANGIRQGGQLSQLLYNVYTDEINHHLLETGVRCYVGGAFVNSLNSQIHADDIVLLAPTVTALQTLLEVYRAYAGPHDIVYNVSGRFSTRVRLGNEELSFVEEFRYLGHIMTGDCRDDKDIKKTIQEAKCSLQYAGQEILICTY